MTEHKKHVIKGLFLALTLALLNRFFISTNYAFYPDMSDMIWWYVALTFGITNLLFLKTKKMNNFFTTGFVGLITLLVFEFMIVPPLRIFGSQMDSLSIYFIGSVGSVTGSIAAAILTAAKIDFKIFSEYKETIMEKTMKLKLLSYLLISAASFSYLILPERAGISVSIFILIQAACLYLLAPTKKPLLMFIPIFLLSLNSFISANHMWRMSNFFVIATLYSIMTLFMVRSFNLKEPSLQFIFETLRKFAEPFRYFTVPLKWGNKVNKEYASTAKRILIGISISIPLVILVVAMLSSADAIFSNNVSDIFSDISNTANVNMVFKSICGLVVGFYLFGLVYSVYQPLEENTAVKINSRKGDLIILNILLTSILAVYTFFVIIQFRYLFAGGDNLPFDLTYTHYARRGFFELLFLTGLNIILILTTTWLTKDQSGHWAWFSKALSCYLCTVTIILLASSFYRMHLYSTDAGLTRLRFLVFGFLVFEAIGLIFTFFYIIKPMFSIINVYLIIGMVYYILLNLIPMDAIIAKNQMDRFLETGEADVYYVFELSVDAAPQIMRLLDNEDVAISDNVKEYLLNNGEYLSNIIPRWQRQNLSINKFFEYRQEVLE